MTEEQCIHSAVSVAYPFAVETQVERNERGNYRVHASAPDWDLQFSVRFEKPVTDEMIGDLVNRIRPGGAHPVG